MEGIAKAKATGAYKGRTATVDTLEIHGARIRLWGIDAPESGQPCRGEDNFQYRCGAKATAR